MKRYLAEDGTAVVRRAMDGAARRVTSRVSYVEAVRAIARVVGWKGSAIRHFRAEWPLLDVVEVDVALTESAARLAVDEGLHTLDALHLASALRVPSEDLALASWDARLHAAARRRGMRVVPDALG